MANKIDFKWDLKAPGVWCTNIANFTGDTLLSVAGAKPSMMALNNMSAANFPFERDVEVEKVTGRIVMRFPLEEKEKIYGL